MLKQETTTNTPIQIGVKTNQIHFVNNLKIALIMLVVAHHAGQPYGPGGWWYYQEDVSMEWLGRFFAVNAAFFMSLFFFLSAYFLIPSIEKKGVPRYLKERLIKLGVPLLLGFFIMMPILMYFYYVNFRGYESISFFTYYLNVYFGLGEVPINWTGPSWPDMQFGHLWFIQHLLVYSLMVGAWLTFTPKKNNKTSVIHINVLQVILFLTVVSLSTFVIRIWYPLDYWIGFLGIIQTEFAHVPQYASFFFLGIIANRYNWLLALSTTTGYVMLALGVFLASLHYFGADFLYPYFAKGGMNVGSLFRSLTETVLCTTLIIGLIILFREKFNRTSTLLNTLSTNVFVVYFIHIPIVVSIQYILAGLDTSTISKFLISTLLGILFSFLFSIYVWRKLPILKKLM